jgi:hypothetical protein
VDALSKLLVAPVPQAQAESTQNPSLLSRLHPPSPVQNQSTKKESQNKEQKRKKKKRVAKKIAKKKKEQRNSKHNSNSRKVLSQKNLKAPRPLYHLHLLHPSHSPKLQNNHLRTQKKVKPSKSRRKSQNIQNLQKTRQRHQSHHQIANTQPQNPQNNLLAPSHQEQSPLASKTTWKKPQPQKEGTGPNGQPHTSTLAKEKTETP